MGISPSHETSDPPPPTPLAIPYLSLPRYFTPAMRDPVGHAHPSRSADVDAIEKALCTLLPPEIVHQIMDEARIWSSCRRDCAAEFTVNASRTIQRSNLTGQEDEVGDLLDGVLVDSEGRTWCLVSAPVGCDSRESRVIQTDGRQKHFVCEIEIETLSKDQGWADQHRDYGTYNNSYSWFEVSLVRNGREVPDTTSIIQHNVVAGQFFKEHLIVLDRSHPLVRAARDGDRVVLWARALYPGWANQVKKTAITVYTSRHV